MPKIFEYLGFVFYFFSNEHLPIHVHVKKQQRISRCELIYNAGKVSLKWKKEKGATPLSNTEQKEAEVFLKKYHKEVVMKWNDYFVFGKKIKSEKIKSL